MCCITTYREQERIIYLFVVSLVTVFPPFFFLLGEWEGELVCIWLVNITHYKKVHTRTWKELIEDVSICNSLSCIIFAPWPPPPPRHPTPSLTLSQSGYMILTSFSIISKLFRKILLVIFSVIILIVFSVCLKISVTGVSSGSVYNKEVFFRVGNLYVWYKKKPLSYMEPTFLKVHKTSVTVGDVTGLHGHLRHQNFRKRCHVQQRKYSMW